MIFRESTKSDFDYLAEHSLSRGIQKYQPEQIDYCYTLEHEGKPLIMGGFHIINLTTCWCWLDLATKDNILTAYRTIKEWLVLFAKEHGIKRLQAYVECDFPEAIRTVEHLGFIRESVMYNFIGDKDAYMYVRFIG